MIKLENGSSTTYIKTNVIKSFKLEEDIHYLGQFLDEPPFKIVYFKIKIYDEDNEIINELVYHTKEDAENACNLIEKEVDKITASNKVYL